MTVEILSLMFVGIIALLSGLFIYFYHQNTKSLAKHNHDAWRHAIVTDQHARKIADSERGKFLTYMQEMAKWNAALVQQCQQSATREIEEARRFMQSVKGDLIKAVTDASSERGAVTRPSPRATSTAVTPATPVLSGVTKK